MCHWTSRGFINPPDIHCSHCDPKIHPNFYSPLYDKGLLRNKLDVTTSLIVRIRCHWTCVKCHKIYPPNIHPLTHLPQNDFFTASHYFNSVHLGTRWDFSNIDGMDRWCHTDIEHHKHEDVDGFNYEKFMISKMGSDKLEQLRKRSVPVLRPTFDTLNQMLTVYTRELDHLLHN